MFRIPRAIHPVILLFVLSICGTTVLAQTPTPVMVKWHGEDSVGRQLAFDVREVVRASKGYRLVETEADAIVSVEPRAPQTGHSSAIAVAYTMWPAARNMFVTVEAIYFWAFIAAAFAGYGLTYRTSQTSEPWLALLFSALGLVFAFAWFLVNKGSKFWQNNWERHVDLLEEMTLGPLYTVIAIDSERNLLTAAARFSVSKVNQMLSLFVTLVWLLLFVRSLGAVSPSLEPDWFKLVLVVLTIIALGALWGFGRSNIGHGKSRLVVRTFDIET